MRKLNLVLLLSLFFCVTLGQVKQGWDVTEIVSPKGKVLQTFKVIASTSFINDSILIISCNDEKILGLISTPSQALFDDTDYRIYKRIEPISSMKDTVGTIYRYVYEHISHRNKLVIMVDDNLSFVMIHPNPHVGLVFHNKKKKRDN